MNSKYIVSDYELVNGDYGNMIRHEASYFLHDGETLPAMSVVRAMESALEAFSRLAYFVEAVDGDEPEIYITHTADEPRYYEERYDQHVEFLDNVHLTLADFGYDV